MQVLTAEVSQDGMSALLKSDYAYASPRRGEVQKACILSLDEDGIVVHLPQTKRDGLVPSKDLEFLEADYRASLQVGDRVPVRILRSSNRSGYVVVSIRQGLGHQDWLRAEELARSGEVIQAEVVDFNRGGVIVPFGRLRGFVPNSHLGLRFRPTHEAKANLVGETLSLVVIEAQQRRRSLVLSARKAQRAVRQQRLERLQEGQVHTGVVENLVPYGAFVNLGGVTGLIHISEMDWSYVKHPSDVLQVGEEMEVLILGVDRERERVSLSRKSLLPAPQPSPPPGPGEWGVIRSTDTPACLADWVELSPKAHSDVEA